jgi:GNAT superfamily N-acetyltransferase
MQSSGGSSDDGGSHSLLAGALRDWLGRWPPERAFDVVGCDRRAEPGWDRLVHPAIAVASPQRMVLSVAADRVAAATALSPAETVDLDRLRAGLGAAVSCPRQPCVQWVFRWSTAPAELPEAGAWISATTGPVPAWLRPFGGEVLVARDGAGRPVGGVGIKRHTPLAHEIAVVVAQQARRRGLGRRLVGQAARRILDGGAVPFYLHAAANTASARLAEAAGFPDTGWHMYELGDEVRTMPARLAKLSRALLHDTTGAAPARVADCPR